MTRSEATRLGIALVAAGVLTDAAPGTHEAKGQRRIHGTATVRGHWANGRRAIIGCEHVAVALAAGWSAEALRACRHTYDYTRGVPVLAPVKRAPARRGCPHACEACSAMERAYAA